MKVFLIGVVVGVVAISVIIPTVFFGPYRAEILTAVITAAACGLPSLGIVLGWLMTMFTLKRATGFVGAADRGYAAQMYRDREGIKFFGQPAAAARSSPALGPGADQPWLPPLGDFEVVDGETGEVSERG